ncbi:sigma 54-interacting transcriptional regulator [Nitrosomonas eutropha]|uniref:sigma 54-interacting transcriptional regulator n=1 Tax=Nitrosomonas eutropha TaxID=916 RepID=UPI0035291DA7
MFALANGGALFLDEIGELTFALQTQLLRVIQEHTFKRVGGNAWQRTSFRLVCATNRNLLAQVKKANSARIFITVSPAISVICLPCGNALKTFFCWPGTF